MNESTDIAVSSARAYTVLKAVSWAVVALAVLAVVFAISQSLMYWDAIKV